MCTLQMRFQCLYVKERRLFGERKHLIQLRGGRCASKLIESNEQYFYLDLRYQTWGSMQLSRLVLYMISNIYIC
eukprot:UN00556